MFHLKTILFISASLLFFSGESSAQENSIPEQIKAITTQYENYESSKSTLEMDALKIKEAELSQSFYKLAASKDILKADLSALSNRGKIKVLSSSDNKLLILGWTDIEATHNLLNIYNPDGTLASQTELTDILDFEYESPTLYELYPLANTEDKYLTLGSTRALSGVYVPHAIAIQIINNTPQLCTDCFTENFLSTAVRRSPEMRRITYAEDTGILRYPVFEENEETGFLKFKKTESLVWNGKKFLQK